jgi:multiple sugar transport system substrate-binding protein
VSGPKVIPFFTTESDPNQLVTLQLLIAEYQRFHPDIEIDIVVASPSSRGRRLLIALASGADLGIFEIEPTFMTDWAEAGYLLPLNDVVAKIGIEDYVDGSLFAYDEQVYAIPYATSVYTLWVRTDLFAQAGLAFPTTYDEVLQAAETLTHGEMYGIALPNGQNNATTNYFSTFLWQNGEDYFDCEGHVTFGEPEVLSIVEKWADLSQFSPPGSTTWGYGEQIEAYLRGRVAMVMYAGRLGVNITDKAPGLADKSVVLFPPWGPEQVTLGVWSRFAIASGTRHRDEAKEFLQWLVSGDRLLRYDMAVPGHMIPPLESVREKSLEYDLPYVKQHQDWLTAFYDWVPYTNHPAMNMGSVRDGRFERSDNIPPWSSVVFDSPGIVDTMLQQITLGGRDPEEAWREAVEKMETAVSEWRSIHPEWISPPC